MESTRQHLLRVSDIIGEIETRLRSLRLQAQKAERYKRYKAELRDIEAFYRQPTGQKLLQKMPVLSQQALAVGQEIGRKAAAATAKPMRNMICMSPTSTATPRIRGDYGAKPAM